MENSEAAVGASRIKIFPIEHPSNALKVAQEYSKAV